MLINEVCKKSGLTKKAIEYYEEQGLVSPEVLENGYRNFTEEEARTLSEIAVLRRLGLSVSEIRGVIEKKTALRDVCNKKAADIDDVKAKYNIMSELARGNDWEKAQSKLNVLEQRKSILSRLLDKFPGYYGQYISIHFARFLNEEICTERQKKAFDTIIEFLDSVEIYIPSELEGYFEELSRNVTDEDISKMNDSMEKAIQDTEEYLKENRETIEQYLKFKDSEEYRNSEAFKLYELLGELNRQNSYNDVLIPAMCELSELYREYQEKLSAANEKFLELYPQLEK